MSDDMDYWLNRTICSVLEEMRACYKTRNFAGLMGMIEEAQSMGNRMESALLDQKDLQSARKKLKDVKEEYKKVKEELDRIKPAEKKED